MRVTTSANARILLRTVSRRKNRRTGEMWFDWTFNLAPGVAEGKSSRNLLAGPGPCPIPRCFKVIGVTDEVSERWAAECCRRFLGFVPALDDRACRDWLCLTL